MAPGRGRRRGRRNNNRQQPQQRQPQTQTGNLPPLPSNNFKAFITMESDWHIGLGAGIPGNIDSLVQRDADEIPGSISAKTLTGVWRDACEAVALGLDNGKTGVWSQYVVYLFGDQPALNKDDSTITSSPIEAALKVRPARLHSDIRDAILSCSNKAVKKALVAAITFSKPGISIDRETGCTKEQFLRNEEMVRAGTYLTSECQLDTSKLDKNQTRVAWALLIAGAKYLKRLGGKRRRGAGKCQLDLAKVKNIDAWLNWIEANPLPSTPPLNPDSDKDNDSDRDQEAKSTTNPNPATTWFKVPLTISTKLPVIIKARTVGNVVETLDYIPGGRLLPIVAKQLGKMGINIIDAIASKQLVVTNATIEINGHAGRPVPLALFYEKMSGGFDKGQVYNLLTEATENLSQEKKSSKDSPKDSLKNKQLKGYRQGYIGQIQIVKENNTYQLPDYTTVNTVIQTHNTIDDASQRPTSDIGGVYTYQAIEAGTTLRAEVKLTQNICNHLEQKDPNWWQKLQGTENIGTSKKDDYGLVEITAATPTKIEQKNVITNIADRQLIAWLLSDTLIRDRQLRPSVSPSDLQDTLEQALNKDLADDKYLKLKAKNSASAFTRQRRTESWQKRWSLPRPSLAGLMAGSCIKFEIETNLELSELNQRLENLAISGIGERTAEGYGQISFNAPILKEKTSKMSAKSKSDPPVNPSMNPQVQSTTDLANSKIPINKKNSFDYARLIETQAWRNAIRSTAKVIAKDPATREELLGIKINSDRTGGHPSMSQLGNLRSLISRLQEPKNISSINDYYGFPKDSESYTAENNTKPKNKDKRIEKWQDTNGGLKKIEDLINSERKIWNELAKHSKISLEDLTLTENAAEFLSEQQWLQTSITDKSSLRLILWAEAIRTVVYECIRAHKRELEASENLTTTAGN